MTKYFRESLTKEEEREFQLWLAESQENQQLLESFRDTAAMQEEINFIGGLATNAAWQRLETQRRRKRLAKIYRYIGYAATIVLVVSASIWLVQPFSQQETKATPYVNIVKNDVQPGSDKAQLFLSDGQQVDLGREHKLSEKNGVQIVDVKGGITYDPTSSTTKKLIYNTLVVPKAGTYHLTLADGTKVWLNAQSQIRFPVQFNQHDRKVYLEGEAYFEVAKDSKRPFSVVINDSNTIEVLGTSFNINSYKATSTTTLVDGSVRVNNGKEQQLLKPGQQAHVGEGIKVEQGDVEKAIAWKGGDFYFKSDGIDEITEQLSRWYDVDFKFKGEIPSVRGYNGNISRNLNLSEALQILSYVSDASFELDGRTVTVIF